MDNVIDLQAVRAQNMMGDIEQAAGDIARQLRSLGCHEVPAELVVKAEDLCRAHGNDEATVAAFGRLFGQMLHKRLQALAPAPVRRRR